VRRRRQPSLSGPDTQPRAPRLRAWQAGSVPTVSTADCSALLASTKPAPGSVVVPTEKPPALESRARSALLVPNTIGLLDMVPSANPLLFAPSMASVTQLPIVRPQAVKVRLGSLANSETVLLLSEVCDSMPSAPVVLLTCAMILT